MGIVPNFFIFLLQVRLSMCYSVASYNVVPQGVFLFLKI
jgi:hypothetical protein